MPDNTKQYDFFVSYARADNKTGWVERFVAALLAAHGKLFPGKPLVHFFDKTDIPALSTWENTLLETISHSRFFLAFISDNYFASKLCRKEWHAWMDAEIAKHILTQGTCPVYFVKVPGFIGQDPFKDQKLAEEIAGRRKLSTPRDIADVAQVVKQVRCRQIISAPDGQPFCDGDINAFPNLGVQTIFERLARELDAGVTRINAAAASESTVPPHNKNFSGRHDELLNLRKSLPDNGTGVICGIHGLGGIGKTELAYTYAHAFAHAYPGGRFYVPCENKTTLRHAVLCLGNFPDIHLQISDEERKNPDTYFAAIQRCLKARLLEKGSILLVLDNVEDSKLLSREQTDELTKLGPNLHLLATTRLEAQENAGNQWLVLGELPKEDALALLERFRPFANDAEHDAAEEIVRLLGGFALAVELVGAYLQAHPGTTYAHIASEWDLQKLDEIADDTRVELRRHNHERRLGAVLGPVLAGLSEVERRILEYASLLPPDSVALPWLLELVEADFPEAFKPTSLIADPWRELWEKLLRLALFSRVEDAERESGATPVLVRVHRLVQELVRRDWKGEHATEREARQAAIEVLIRRQDDVLEETTEWEGARWELVPFAALGNLWDEWGHPNAAWLLNQAGQRWDALAEYSEAEPLMQRALRIDEKSLGKNHPKVAIRLGNLASLLYAMNRLEEAEPLMREALEIDENSFGPNHPEVATDLNNLASLLQATNRLEEAEPLMLRALAIDEKSFGKNHPNVAIRLNNLASLLYAMNRLEEAEPLMRKALKIDEKSFGKNHPNIAIHLNNLAQLLQATNRLEEAEPLMRKALKINEKSFGKNHPNVARNLNNLAQLLQDTNRLKKAEPLMKRVLKIFEASYGMDHPNVATCLNNLASLLQDTNRLEEAEPLMKRALEIFEASYGAAHPDVATNLNNLALLLLATNRLEEAEPLMQRALKIDEKSFGPNHPNVARDLNNLALLLKATNHLEEAEPLMQRALKIDEKSFGPNHPNVARDLNNLAQLLKDTNRREEAEPLMQRMLIIFLNFTRQTGHTHPHLETAFNNYIALLAKLGRGEEEIRAILREIAPKFVK